MGRLPAGFDRALPTLEAALDAEAVADRVVPAGWEQATVRLADVKYRPHTSCVTAWRVDGRADDDGAVDGLVTTFAAVFATPDGLAHHLYDADPELKGIAVASDGDAIAQRLGADRAPIQVTPVRYKPRSRCVLRYQSATDTLFGKVLSGPSQGLADTLERLQAAAAASPRFPAVAPVVFHDPRLHLVVQSEVGTGELHARGFDAREDGTARRAWLTAAGQALAQLHGSAVVGLPAVMLADDEEELASYTPIIAVADETLAERYGAALAALRAASARAAGSGGGARPVPSHGALRTDQLLLGPDRPVLMDLDGACSAEPGRDLGNLLAYLDWKAVRQTEIAAIVAEAGEAFEAGYRGERPWPAERLAVWRAASLLKITGRRFRSLAVDEWPLVGALVDRAEQLVSS